MKEKSIRSFAWRMLLFFLVPVTLIVAAATMHQVSASYKNNLYEASSTLHAMVLPLKGELENLEKNLQDMVNDNIAARAISNPSNLSQLSINSYVIRTALDTLFGTNQDLSMAMFYSPNTNVMLSKDDGFTSAPREARSALMVGLKASFINTIQTGTVNTEDWFVLEYYGRIFLMRVVNNDGMYAACLFDLVDIIYRMEEDYSSSVGLVFRDGDTLLTDWPLDKISVPEWRDGGIYLGPARRYLAVSEKVANITLTRISTYSALFYRQNLFAVILATLAILMVLALPVQLLIWNRRFFRPMNKLVQTMESISDGTIDLRAENSKGGGDEVQEVITTFNQMMEHIEQLKIEQYETELQTRQAQLQYYQAQIRPHFYLNCLKNLYALAQQNERENIEQSILLLSNHLRYCFQWQTETVSLSEELHMCSNYVQLMGISAAIPPELVLDVDDVFLNAAIPPVSLLTLVENSLKYGMSDQKAAILNISARRIQTEGAGYLQLAVHDNGPGFSEQLLDELNSMHEVKESSSHVGLKNMLIRFRLIYGDRFDAAFFNDDGAVVELFIEQEPEGGLQI